MTRPAPYALAMTLLALAGCENEAARREPIPVVLKAEKGEGTTLNIPRGYIEEPKKPEGVLPNVLLRIAAKDFSEPGVFAQDSEVRILIEPAASKADAGHELQAAALRRPRGSEEAIVKSAEQSTKELLVYTYPNGRENAEAYYLKSKSGDVFVECWKSVCKAFKTWNKQVHTRFDYQPMQTSDIVAVDATVDRMMQSFASQATAAK